VRLSVELAEDQIYGVAADGVGDDSADGFVMVEMVVDPFPLVVGERGGPVHPRQPRRSGCHADTWWT
jgi:hypothetical protein